MDDSTSYIHPGFTPVPRSATHGDGELDVQSDESQSKKKRRVDKAGEKKYNCSHPGCDRAYSRAEHLYRHQLNHTPKQIYYCDLPGCDRNFVRADLCARHKERHLSKGSHLQRKDAFLNSKRMPATDSTHSNSPMGSATTSASADLSPASSRDTPHAHASTPRTVPDHFMPPPPPPPGHPAYPVYFNGMAPAPAHAPDRHLDGSFGRSPSLTQGYVVGQPIPMASPSPMYAPVEHYPGGPPLKPPGHTRSSVLPPVAIPPGFGQHAGGRLSSDPLLPAPTMTTADHYQYSRSNSLVDLSMFEQYGANYAMPVFANDGYYRYPPAMDDAFFLLEGNGIELPIASPPFDTPPPFSMPAPPPAADSIAYDRSTGGAEARPAPVWPSQMNIDLPECNVTPKKQGRIIQLFETFVETDHALIRKLKDHLLAGDVTDDGHPLSVLKLKTYISSYWVHVHKQMPILHRPTFNPETCPDLLLLAMICLGATCLERARSPDASISPTDLANFAAYHIRWQVFKDSEFRPTAKLWTFQTMLLIELFEKLYSTHQLHERATVHHATTLTVMRRGSSLVGRSASDDHHDDPTRTPPGPEGTVNVAGQNTGDAFWNRWITAEATRRAAFASFIIDSTHATLFGHAAAMSPHDIHLPLPCDEALWAATSSAEVQRVEASLAANGFKPILFLDALKRTLHGAKVRTNTFGRVILMAGLLNLSWHMNQHDLQVSPFGSASTLTNNVRWRSQLTHAFDFWRRDFDDSISKADYSPEASSKVGTIDARDNVLESRTCLHSLAHMSMHIDMVDCEIFAGADRLLGRTVTDQDRSAVVERMRTKWAPSARARDATFYALRFLCEVLVPGAHDPHAADRPRPAVFPYSVRDDYVLNRPWVVYFACMVVWAFGYALDGALAAPHPDLAATPARIQDMQAYLVRLSSVGSPDDLADAPARNACLGLLMLCRDGFKESRWELLHGASDNLARCIERLIPAPSPADAQPARTRA